MYPVRDKDNNLVEMSEEDLRAEFEHIDYHTYATLACDYEDSRFEHSENEFVFWKYVDLRKHFKI